MNTTVNGKTVKVNGSVVRYYGDEYLIVEVDHVNRKVIGKCEDSGRLENFDFDFFSEDLYQDCYIEFGKFYEGHYKLNIGKCNLDLGKLEYE